ncbi:hypothetical protein SAMN02745121_00398 [Nannocystis exedens]|uniref:Uncharacterized protein n=1 Tax=Nannocystis exedens TaxID=54 RepID=A0A1I1SZY7_9BACT|nr:hypothetical protein [Nannocystis exedens]PCC66874.1 hypothetical protein NAEX_09470 [Nannocystis exedens]SFD52004.1 hypothetical protein SAMN02745121_00398 [Nannocystis exedens]
MSAQKVVDLVVEHGRVQIVQPGAGVAPQAAPAPLSTALATRDVASVTTPWSVLLGSGAACMALGAITLGLFPFSVIGLVLTNLLFSAGAGLAVLAFAKRTSSAGSAGPTALPARVDPSLLAERSRRVRAILRGTGPTTFERIKSELKWTQVALVSTLVHMKEQGEVVEDLSLDTGEWVYTLADNPDAVLGSPTLAERQAQVGEVKGQG